MKLDDGEWQSICYQKFNLIAADKICKNLGFNEERN
jgi:hypothetical protein